MKKEKNTKKFKIFSKNDLLFVFFLLHTENCVVYYSRKKEKKS